MPPASHRPRRSVLYVPASNERALGQDFVARLRRGDPRSRGRGRPRREGGGARKAVRFHEAARRPAGRRSSSASTRSPANGARTICCWPARCSPTASCCPRSTRRATSLEAGDVLDDNFAADTTKLWAMIETPKAILNIGAIAELGRDPASRLACLVAGTNDLAKETGIRLDAGPPLPRAAAGADGGRGAGRRAWSCSTASSTNSRMPSALRANARKRPAWALTARR